MKRQGLSFDMQGPSRGRGRNGWRPPCGGIQRWQFFEGHRHHDAELILLASSSSLKGFAMAKSAKEKRRGSDENLFSARPPR
jgi:hypothetical protein